MAVSGVRGTVPFPALLAHPAVELVGDHRPRLRPVVLDKLEEVRVLLGRPRTLEDTLASELLLGPWIAWIAWIAAWFTPG